RLGEAELAQRLEVYAERTDGAGDPAAGGDASSCEGDAGAVDLGDLVAQAILGQNHRVRAEGVGFKNLGAGVGIGAVNLLHDRRLGDVELVKAAVDEDAVGVEHGAHGAIGDEHALGDLGEEV